MTERIDATNTTEHMADAESTAESAKAAVRGVEETHPEYVDFAVDDFPGGLPACLEAILMVADQPQTATELARILALDRNTVEEALRALHDDYEGDESRDIRPRGFELRRTARGWQFASRAAFEPVVSSFVTDGQTARLSQAALEALAIVAYRQPVTRAQVAAIRGVNSDDSLAHGTRPYQGRRRGPRIPRGPLGHLRILPRPNGSEESRRTTLPSAIPPVRRRNDTVEIGRYGRDFVAIGARCLTNIRALDHPICDLWSL